MYILNFLPDAFTFPSRVPFRALVVGPDTAYKKGGVQGGKV